jgi:hypothetical protein
LHGSASGRGRREVDGDERKDLSTSNLAGARADGKAAPAVMKAFYAGPWLASLI